MVGIWWVYIYGEYMVGIYMVGHYTSQQSMCLRCRRTVTARLGNNVLCSLYSSLSHHAHNSFLFFANTSIGDLVI